MTAKGLRGNYLSVRTNGEVRQTDVKTAEKTHDEKRVLRSQDGGSRIKSDLALYFPYYEEYMLNGPKKPEFLTPETPIFIEDDPSAVTKSKAVPSTPTKSSPRKRKDSQLKYSHSPSALHKSSPLRSPAQPSRLLDIKEVDFSSLSTATNGLKDDPLPDTLYLKSHRRAERQEKQLRNIEKERAQHEKYQLEKILEGLKGYDWLRVMGISGITETEKKSLEPKRDHFIEEVDFLVEKFKAWREEEKRRKLEKDQASLEVEDEKLVEPEEENGLCADVFSDGGPDDCSDVDALAARQLFTEARRAKGVESPALRVQMDDPTYKVEKPSPPPKPFLSFYSKPHIRAAAIGNHRRSGRSATRFRITSTGAKKAGFYSARLHFDRKIDYQDSASKTKNSPREQNR